jgi:hypothetical protein
MRQFASHGYIVQDGDRDAGFIKAEKSRSSSLGSVLAGAEYFTEMVVNIIPSTEGGGSDIRLLVSRTKQASGQQRTSAGVQLKSEDEEDAAEITAACGVPVGESGDLSHGFLQGAVRAR